MTTSERTPRAPDWKANELDPNGSAAANVVWSNEIALLRQEMTGLVTELEEAKRGSRVDRDARRAALNLMEDAVAARKAQQHENMERRRAEEELRASEEKYRTLFESIDEGFFIVERIAVEE